MGYVFVSCEGAALARGFIQQEGGLHAEVMALRDATANGATAYVDVEPCTHHDRALPSGDAFVQARVDQVVASIEDRNLLVAGQGFARLRAASVEVEIGPGAEESREFNMGTSVK